MKRSDFLRSVLLAPFAGLLGLRSTANVRPLYADIHIDASNATVTSGTYVNADCWTIVYDGGGQFSDGISWSGNAP